MDGKLTVLVEERTRKGSGIRDKQSFKGRKGGEELELEPLNGQGKDGGSGEKRIERRYHIEMKEKQGKTICNVLSGR